MVQDPSTALPYLVMGIQTYIGIGMLIHLIDQSQPDFLQFLEGNTVDLNAYATFLQSQYMLAINGIVNSDIPLYKDIWSFVFMSLYLKKAIPGPNWGSFPDPVPREGYAWNGVYGVVNTYPRFGAYEPSAPVPVPFASPGGIIDFINTDHITVLAEIVATEYDLDYTMSEWVAPWVQANVILGRMARWKALYLING